MLFPVQPSREAGEGVVAAHHAVAGNEYVNPIGTDGVSHGSHCFFIANHFRYFLITPCFSVGYVEQRTPDLDLKVCAYRVQRDVKLFASACKIFIKLLLRLFN